MDQEMVIRLMRGAIEIMILVGMPVLVGSLIVGLIISILQTVTSIHDPNLTFVPKMLTIFAVGLLALPWMIAKITTYTTQLFSDFSVYTR